LAEFLSLLNETSDDFNGTETVFYHGVAVFALGIEDIGGYYCGEIVEVHFTAAFFVDVGEGGHPGEEGKDYFHGIAVAFREEAAA
jgi:hypothetical protein